MKGAVQLDRSFRHDESEGLHEARARHAEVSNVNDARSRIMWSR
jgi:hypothetical protein